MFDLGDLFKDIAKRDQAVKEAAASIGDISRSLGPLRLEPERIGWTPDERQALLDVLKSIGGQLSDIRARLDALEARPTAAAVPHSSAPQGGGAGQSGGASLPPAP